MIKDKSWEETDLHIQYFIQVNAIYDQLYRCEKRNYVITMITTKEYMTTITNSFYGDGICSLSWS